MNRNLLEGLMKIRGVSKADLAAQLGINLSSLYRRLSGENDFSLSEIKKIQRILDLNTTDVVLIFLED